MKAQKILILNGPNLNLLGLREPAKYGKTTLCDLESMCMEKAAQLTKTWGVSVEVECIQSNHEGILIDAIHKAGRDYEDGKLCGVVLNAGGYTHTSVALRDAIAGASPPEHPLSVVEVHISNVHARESFRQHSYISAVALGVIVGCGLRGYLMAMEYLYEFHQIGKRI